MVVKDILGVIYAPHKVFKRIAGNPKYLAVAIIILLSVALQVSYYYSYYSKVHYEQTMPPVGQLNAFTTTNATQWMTTHGTTVMENSQDFINQTFYGNSSLQFTLPKSNSLSITLEQFGYTADCSSDGFTSLNMNIKQVSPNTAPQSGVMTLYTANGTSNYFTLEITSMLAKNFDNWNNLTIPVGTSEWQNTGSPNWTEVTGLKLTLTYSTSSSDINILLQGLFFRGQYLTQTNALGTGAFLSVATFSIVMQTAFQWIILTIVSYLILKGLKVTNIVWKPLIIVIGYTLMALVIIATLNALSTLTLLTVHYPYDFPPYVALVYPDFIINGASSTSQIAYESIVSATSTYTVINTIITIFMYVWQVALITFAVKAVSGYTYTKNTTTSNTTTTETITNNAATELSYIKCIITAVITVISTFMLLNILSWLGMF